MRIDINGHCGCGFTLEAQQRAATVTLRSKGTTVARRYDDVDPREVHDVIDFVRSVSVAVEADEVNHQTRENFCDPSYYSEALGLLSEFDLVDDSNHHLRGTFTLYSRGDDSLGYEHVRVTVHLSPRQLLDGIRSADTTDFYWN